AFPDSSRDFQFNAAQFFHASLPVALRTRLLDDFAGAATAGTGLRNVKKSSRTDHLTTAAAGRTVNRTRTRLSPAAMTLVTGIELLDFNLFFDPESRFFEADLHVVTQIRSALAIFSAPACASKECLENSAAESTSAKDFAENVERIMETTETSATRGKGSVTEAVVGGALIRIHKDIISFPKLLEFFLGMRIVRVFVRMKLDGEFTISALNLLFGGIPHHAKHFVVIAFFRGHVTDKSV